MQIKKFLSYPDPNTGNMIQLDDPETGKPIDVADFPCPHCKAMVPFAGLAGISCIVAYECICGCIFRTKDGVLLTSPGQAPRSILELIHSPIHHKGKLVNPPNLPCPLCNNLMRLSGMTLRNGAIGYQCDCGHTLRAEAQVLLTPPTQAPEPPVATPQATEPSLPQDLEPPPVVTEEEPVSTPSGEEKVKCLYLPCPVFIKKIEGAQSVELYCEGHEYRAPCHVAEDKRATLDPQSLLAELETLRWWAFVMEQKARDEAVQQQEKARRAGLREGRDWEERVPDSYFWR